MGQCHERKSHQNLKPNQSPGPSYCEVRVELQRNLIGLSARLFSDYGNLHVFCHDVFAWFQTVFFIAFLH